MSSSPPKEVTRKGNSRRVAFCERLLTIARLITKGPPPNTIKPSKAG